MHKYYVGSPILQCTSCLRKSKEIAKMVDCLSVISFISNVLLTMQDIPAPLIVSVILE